MTRLLPMPWYRRGVLLQTHPHRMTATRRTPPREAGDILPNKGYTSRTATDAPLLYDNGLEQTSLHDAIRRSSGKRFVLPVLYHSQP